MFQIIFSHQPFDYRSKGVHANRARMVQIWRSRDGQHPIEQVFPHHVLEVLHRTANVKGVFASLGLHDGKGAGVVIFRLAVVWTAGRVDIYAIFRLGAVAHDAIWGCGRGVDFAKDSAVRWDQYREKPYPRPMAL